MPPDADVIYDVDGDEVDPGLLEHGDVVYDEVGNEYVFVEDGAEEPVGKGFIPPRAALGIGAKQLGSDTKQFLARNKKPLAAGAVLGTGLGAGATYGLKKSAGDTVLEALSKAANDDDRDQIIAKAMSEVEVYKAQTEELSEALAYEQDLRLTDAYISKAAEYNLPVSPQVFGPILKSIAETLSDEELDILDAIFEAIGDALYDEVGYVGDTDNGSVVDMVDAYADELVGKSDMTHAEAAVAMYSSHPEAYEAYLAENGR